MQHHNVITTIKNEAIKDKGLDVVWLYGSRAKTNWQENSDFDIAIAINNLATAENYDCDELAYQLSTLTDSEISIVDINKIPVPLAAEVIADGIVLISKNDLRLHTEMQRIWSLWEQYRHEHKKRRK